MIKEERKYLKHGIKKALEEEEMEKNREVRRTRTGPQEIILEAWNRLAQ